MLRIDYNAMLNAPSTRDTYTLDRRGVFALLQLIHILEYESIYEGASAAQLDEIKAILAQLDYDLRPSP